MMKVFLFISLAVSAVAFAPIVVTTKSAPRTKLEVHRRDVLLTTLVGLVAGPPLAANAKPASTFFYDEKIELVREPSQMPTSGKLDLNSAFVGEYKAFPGMFPHAAGKLASNGPYVSVKDIYKIDGLSANDVKLFKKYDKYFTVNPPGRSFNERINARVST